MSALLMRHLSDASLLMQDESGTVYDEAGVAEDMLLFLTAFREAHPTYFKAPLFITGESYGGGALLLPGPPSCKLIIMVFKTNLSLHGTVRLPRTAASVLCAGHYVPAVTSAIYKYNRVLLLSKPLALQVFFKPFACFPAELGRVADDRRLRTPSSYKAWQLGMG